MPHFIYKHSPTCGMSARAKTQVDRFRAAHPSVPLEELDVFRDRSRCDAIETDTGVRHESPQILLFNGDDVVWHASHGRVTSDAMLAAWEAASAERR
jgi:bacillithiol system protein YtxJ